MASRSIAVSILADTKELSRNLSKAEGDLNSFGSEADEQAKKARRSLEEVGDSAGDTASASSQVAGAFGDIGGSLNTMGFISDGAAAKMDTLGFAIMGITGVADLAEVAMSKLKLQTIGAKVATLAKTVADKAAAVATKAFTAAQAALNAVMAGNPIALTVLALAALAVALVIAYKKSATFRAIVNGAFGAVLKVVKTFASFFVKTIPAAVSKVIGFVKGHWKPIVAIMLGPIGLLVYGITKNLDKIKAGFTNTVAFIKGIPAKIRGLVGSFKDAGTDLIQALISGLKNVGGTIGDIGKAIFNSVIGFLNSHLPHSLSVNKGPIHISVPLFPNIPMLASGGIVTGPTLALIGEAGPEAVVPLNHRFRNNVTINVKVTADGIVQTDAELGSRVIQAIEAAYQAGELPLA